MLSAMTLKRNVTKEVEIVDQQWVPSKRVVAGNSDRPPVEPLSQAAYSG
jgi:hypothetical protein